MLVAHPKKENNEEESKMDPASYIAAAGLKANLRALDIASNNMANSQSPGFKADSPFYRMLNASYGELSGSTVQGTATDFRIGSFRTTSNPLDFAINGEGFFTVRTPAGTGYTRNGSFSISQAGELVTQDGFQVLDRNGSPIPVALDPSKGNEIVVNKLGEISIDDVTIGTIGIVRFDNLNALEKQGDNMFTSNSQPQQMLTPTIEQGVIEGSNADPITTMLEMVELQRMYDMNSKTVQTLMANLNRRAVRDIVSQQ